MKGKADLAQGWLRKANSDAVAMNASFDAGAFDAACFHAQQVAEKSLKAYLVYAGVAFPFTHNLAKLVENCADKDESFRGLISRVEPLTPYAVELRYDAEFWPTKDAAQEACSLALSIKAFVFEKLPPEIACCL